MRSPLLLQCRFALSRAWRSDRIGTLTYCVLIAMGVVCGSAAVAEYRTARRIEIIYAGLDIAPSRMPATLSKSADGQITLGAFQSQALPDALNSAAVTFSLPVNEMIFRLDDNAAQPYLRYSATVKVFGGYQVMRKFVAAVRASNPETSLDAISCTRSDIRSVHLNCELILSAFYRRDPHA